MAVAAKTQTQNRQAMIEAGGKLFNPTCSSGYCHGANGTGGSAPSLQGRNFTPEYLTTVITDGAPFMRGFKDDYSAEQIQQIVAYVMSLPRGKEPARAAAQPEARPAGRRAGGWINTLRI
ncbi:MAG: cytochrome c [Acidobacteria bacterium]|nr:cytochrome c [Acidobacteriota bacterium]